MISTCFGSMSLDGDLFTWQYVYVPSAGQGPHGFLESISLINAKDLADNLVQESYDLDANDDGVDDILFLDNTNETSYVYL